MKSLSWVLAGLCFVATGEAGAQAVVQADQIPSWASGPWADSKDDVRPCHTVWKAKGPYHIEEWTPPGVSAKRAAKKPPLRGRVCLMVEAELADQIGFFLARYMRALEIDGYAPFTRRVSGGTAEELRSTLRGFYAEPESLVGAVLIGELPYAIFELNETWGTEFDKAQEYEDFPCDLFLMDMDGTWTDTTTNGQVQPNNGKYDTCANWTGLEIWVGRIRADNLSRLGAENVVIGCLLERTYRYRTGQLSTGVSSLVYNDDSDSWATFFAEYDATQMSAVYGSAKIVTISDAETTTAANYIANYLAGSYQMVSLRSRQENATSHKFYRENKTLFEYVQASDYVSADRSALFYLLYGGCGCDYTVSNNLGGTVALSTSSKSLLTLGSSKKGGMLFSAPFFSALAAGEDFGKSFLSFYNLATGDVIKWLFGMVLLGDPSVRPMVDSDLDGMPDYWEKQYLLDPNSAEGEDGQTGNPDGDRMTNIDEYLSGSDPQVPCPDVVSIDRASGTPTNASSVTFDVTFNMEVTGVDLSDFLCSTSGLTGVEVASVTGAGALYSVIVNTGTGDGTLRLDLVDDDSIVSSGEETGGEPLGGYNAGNGSYSGGESYTLDRTPPNAPSVSGPLPPTNIVQPTWTWTAGGGGNGVFQFQLDSESETWTQTSSRTWTPDTALLDGTHTLYVRERDTVGNWGASGSYTLEVDSDAADPPTFVGGQTLTNDSTPTWAWVSSGGGNGIYRCQLDSYTGGAWVIVFTREWTPDTDLEDGAHTLYVQESDGTKGWGSMGAATITVDTTPPLPPAVAGSTPTNDSTPTWTWTSSGGGNGTYQYQLGSELGAWSTTSAAAWTPTTALPDAAHTLYVRERDGAGNWSASGARTIVVDTTPPVIALNGQGTLRVFRTTAYTDAGATATDTRDGNLTSRIVVTGLPLSTGVVGTYYVRYNVRDYSNNAATEVIRTVVVIPETPQTYHVDASYVGVEDGSALHPFNTITEALVQAAGTRRDTIWVAPGDYPEEITLLDSLTLVGKEGAYYTRLGWSKASGDVVTLATDSVLRGFTIGGAATGCAAVRVPAVAASAVMNCVITECDFGVAVDANGYLIQSVNNTFYANTDSAVFVAANGRVFHAKNCIFAENETAMTVEAGGILADVSYCDFWNNATDLDGSATSWTDILRVDPLHVDVATFNFHLQLTSLCRDGGDPLSGYNDRDGTRNDVGADGGILGAFDIFAPTAVIVTTPDPAEGEAPLQVHFDATQSADEWGIGEYLWNFGDKAGDVGVSEKETGAVIDKVYTTPGTYQVRLKVTDNSGWTTYATKRVEVRGAPSIALQRTPLAGPVALSVDSSAQGQAWNGGAVTFEWDFNEDGVADATGATASFTYPVGTPLGSHQIAATSIDGEGRRSTKSLCVTLTRYPVLAAALIEPPNTGVVAVSMPRHELDGTLLTIPTGAISMPIVASVGTLAIKSDLPECPNPLIAAEFGPCNMTFATYVTVRMPTGDYAGSGYGLKVVRLDADEGAWTEDGVNLLSYSDGLVVFETSELGVFVLTYSLPADVNVDGVVDALDVQTIVNAALGLPGEGSADLNGDGTVDALDVQIVINAALGIYAKAAP